MKGEGVGGRTWRNLRDEVSIHWGGRTYGLRFGGRVSRRIGGEKDTPGQA